MVRLSLLVVCVVLIHWQVFRVLGVTRSVHGLGSVSTIKQWTGQHEGCPVNIQDNPITKTDCMRPCVTDIPDAHKLIQRRSWHSDWIVMFQDASSTWSKPYLVLLKPRGEVKSNDIELRPMPNGFERCVWMRRCNRRVVIWCSRSCSHPKGKSGSRKVKSSNRRSEDSTLSLWSSIATARVHDPVDFTFPLPLLVKYAVLYSWKTFIP